MAPPNQGRRVDIERLGRDLSSWKWPFALILLFVAGLPLGFVIVSAVAGAPWDVVLAGVLVSLLLGMLLALLTSRPGLRTYNYAVREVTEIVKEEWRTGRAVLPHDFAKRWGARQFGVPPQPSEESLKRMRLARRIEKGRWMLFLSMAMFLGFLVPFQLFAALGLRGLVPVTVTGVLTFWPLVAMLLLIAKVKDGVPLLREAREYEKASGRRILPDGLSSGATHGALEGPEPR